MTTRIPAIKNQRIQFNENKIELCFSTISTSEFDIILVFGVDWFFFSKQCLIKNQRVLFFDFIEF
jgi:hypothetical protein